MTGSTSKKVVVRRFDRESLAGFVNPQTWLQDKGVEMLSPSGIMALVPYGEVKTVSFVRDFDTADLTPDQKVFNTRPKMSGIWLRMRFRDGEVMEGLLSNNLLQMEPQGFTVIPPNPSSNNQRIFIPRAALCECQVLGVIGSPLTERKPKAKPRDQIGLFD